jgi:hypothetical protein
VRGINVLIAALCACVSLATSSFAAAQSNDQTQIAHALASGTLAQREAALLRIRRTPIESRSPAVLPALFQELERQRARLRERESALESGHPLPPSEAEGEFLIDVLDTVTQYSSDPRIIRPLLPFIGLGNRIMNVLAAFGEQSVADVAVIAGSDTSSAGDVHAALTILQRMLDGPTSYPLSEQSRQRIVEVARARLTSARASNYVVPAAMRLAVATGDAQLIQLVQELARNPASALQKSAQTALETRQPH